MKSLNESLNSYVRKRKRDSESELNVDGLGLSDLLKFARCLF